MNDIMLDLETMSTNPNAAIIAIGAVAFNQKDGVVDRFDVQVNLDSAMQCGGWVDGSTVMWWLKQSNEARSNFSNNDSAPHINEALNRFAEFYKKHGGKVYGNGAMFDNAILGNAYKRAGFEIPWKFWNDMCYRTIKNMNKHIELERIGIYHNAVDDAESQALHLIKILNQ